MVELLQEFGCLQAKFARAGAADALLQIGRACKDVNRN